MDQLNHSTGIPIVQTSDNSPTFVRQKYPTTKRDDQEKISADKKSRVSVDVRPMQKDDRRPESAAPSIRTDGKDQNASLTCDCDPECRIEEENDDFATLAFDKTAFENQNIN